MYETSNLVLVDQSASGVQEWMYTSTDSAPVVLGANFIRDAKDRGLAPGDVVTIRIAGTETAFGAIATIQNIVDATVMSVSAAGAILSTVPQSFVGDSGTGGVAGAVPAPAAGDAGKVLRGDGTWGAVPVGDLPAPSVSVLGGVKSLAAVAHKFLTSIGTDGLPVAAQPVAADISGLAGGYAALAGGGTISIKHDGSGDYTDLNAFILSMVSRIPVGTQLVNLDAGVHNYASSIYIPLNWTKWANIQGASVANTTVTSIAGSSGSAGAWSVVLNVASTAGITAPVGGVTQSYAMISNATGGTNPSFIEGCWPVTAVGAGTITIATKHKYSAAPSDAVAATVAVPSTVIKCTGCSGLQIWDGASAINVGNLVLVGDGVTANAHGIDLQDEGRLNVTGVLGIYGFGSYNFYANLNSECNSTSGLLAASGSASAGFVVESGAVVDSAAEIISTGNGGQGIYLTGGAYMRSLAASPAVCVSGNTSDGVYIAGNAVLSTPGGWTEATANGGYGAHTASGGMFDSTCYGDAYNTSGLFGGGTLVNRGSLLASAALVAGLLEYDGNAFYASPNTTVRGVLAVKQRSAVENNLNLNASAAAAQSFLPAGAQTFPVVAGVRYRIKARIQLYWLNNTNTGTVSVVFTLGGGATVTFIRYTALSVEGTNVMIAPTPAIIALVNGAAAAVVTTTSTNVIKDIEIDGTAEFSAGGTITPKVQWSADTSGAAPQVVTSSYFELETLTTGLATSGLT